MHGLVVSALVLPNCAGDKWNDDSNFPHDPVIGSTITHCLSSITDNVIFISYYKLALNVQDYRIVGKKSTPDGKKKQKQGTVIGTFLTASPKGIVFYQTSSSYTNGYVYGKFLSDLLNIWSLDKSKYHIFLSHQMKCSEEASEKIQASRNNVLIFPASNYNVHLGDVLFYNIADKI